MRRLLHNLGIGLVPPSIIALLGLLGPTQLAGQNQEDGPTTPRATWSLAATGDTIITRQIRHLNEDPAFMAVVDKIRSADAATTNLEGHLFRMSEFKGYPQAERGGSYLVGPPESGADLKWMGFDLITTANNHSTDFGVEGMLETMRLLDSLNLVHAGSGMTAGEAAQARYFETTGGRFALIGMATSFTPMSQAGDPRPEYRGRPGVNALRIDYKRQLTAAQMDILRSFVEEVGVGTKGRHAAVLKRAGSYKTGKFLFGGVDYVTGPENKELYTINAEDEARVLRSIRNASRQADNIVAFSHSHDVAWNASDAPAPEHFRIFIRKCLDAGADAFIISGPHVLRGVEIYQGKPIFYSLGNFFFQNESVDPIPNDTFETFGLGANVQASEYYDARGIPDPKTGIPTTYLSANPAVFESVVPVCTFNGDKVIEIKFYPIELGYGSPRSQIGTPRLAGPEMGRSIIEQLASYSEPYGTKIVYEDGIGVWRSTD
jgi:poly-gamma-glutamate capsule biosynthesis protein CapA/YwtB (metallophosphatase superfamily)